MRSVYSEVLEAQPEANRIMHLGPEFAGRGPEISSSFKVPSKPFQAGGTGNRKGGAESSERVVRRGVRRITI